MRYLTFTYYKKANSQIDEVTAVSKNVKTRDWQTANVILDFRDQKVLKCSIGGNLGTRDWDAMVAYYYPNYTHIMERLFRENGHELPKPNEPQAQSPETNPS